MEREVIAYYNEFDAHAAQWLRNLIEAGHIAPGHVDDRSIHDVTTADLSGYTQCHFFAGIGVWSHALRNAGWSDDREVWTGSCPCQPFSAAGRGGGTDDPRHLWPEFFRLIRQCRPRVVFGEQVASKDGLAWLDAVSTDLEGADYTIGAVDSCAAGFGAPHIRQRLYFVAHTGRHESLRRDPVRRADGTDASTAREMQGCGGERIRTLDDLADGSTCSVVADTSGSGLGERSERDSESQQPRQQAPFGDDAAGCCVSCELADTELHGHCGQEADAPEQGRDGSRDGLLDRGAGGLRGTSTRTTNGHWRAADWLLCRDGKWRPVEPGTFPLAHGAPARVGRLRAYGNGLVAPQAEAVIRAAMEVLPK